MTPYFRRTVPAFLTLIATLIIFASPLIASPPADQAVCAVCGPREGAGFEPVKARATHKGKVYEFCSTKCKVEFLSNPDTFLITDQGKPAPLFRLSTIAGKEFTSAEIKGKVVLLDFWATFCAPCMKALPELQALHSRYSSRGFMVVGLSVDERLDLVRKATKKITYPTLTATPEVWNAYRINALPSLVLVGRDGRIIRRFGGEADKKLMIAEIEKALGAK